MFRFTLSKLSQSHEIQMADIEKRIAQRLAVRIAKRRAKAQGVAIVIDFFGGCGVASALNEAQQLINDAQDVRAAARLTALLLTRDKAALKKQLQGLGEDQLDKWIDQQIKGI
ncbi:hypothetical protein CAOG_06876 [Capsaspora owczarzaki ATCC 30864]|uniref:Uncharacterized protein n=1 Tax=Capsaspora owczarzaki (strain ATCC 30864) TaxID=595528 RepID=A0A0D2WW11_CAPO3|nr:hypothetical protein CAOG_06876 [Capsaspora owczarzaki ATCC 30864]KJE96573.1 hypothetical protein CAOG_006876 [Capsaspora owczarzaki ATCC 30864]|eukprot:XP_004344497.1 hypothetical protein CAOG_06876 [Capsaspora owczarzaki ATCC 30864]